MNLLRGIVHGRMIELDNELGLPDGQAITLFVQPPSTTAENVGPEQTETSLRLAFGAWAEDTGELDEYLKWNRQQRRVGRMEMEP